MLPPGETIIETKKCRMSGQEFFVTDRDIAFLDKVSPVFAGKKYSIPTPTLCPEERMRRRIAFRNPRTVYLRKCDASGKTIFSPHSPDKPYPVYDNEIFYGDSWNPFSYARSFDLDKTFHEQFLQLNIEVPHFARSVSNLVNSDYCSSCNDLKDSYLCGNGGDSEKMLYCNGFKRCMNCVDSTLLLDSRNCYMCIDSENCDTCFYLQNSSHCNECWYCDECVGCKNCFCCANLRNKQYCIANQQYDKTEYFKKIAEIQRSTPNIEKFARDWSSKQIKKNLHLLKTENSIGDYLVNTSNCYHCFECMEVQNLRYCDTIKTGHDCMDISSFGWHPEWSYECSGLGHNANHILFCFLVLQDVKDVYYSSYCQRVSDCFGCVGLHSHEHHCIMNKAYSVAEYENLCGKIIDHMMSTGEWGEYFSPAVSPFAYNESVAQEYFPMTEKEVQEKGWNWHHDVSVQLSGTPLTPLPIDMYDERKVGYENAQKNIDALLSSTIVCEITGKPFKIIKQELAFYIEYSLAIPKKHPSQRHKERMDLRNPRRFSERSCAECQKTIITTYAPDRPEKVVCEECYRKIVY